jgi:hypothetical protein
LKDADDKDSSKGKNDGKWWLPTPKVPVDGLYDACSKKNYQDYGYRLCESST